MFVTGEQVRRACREGTWASPTSGLAYGFVQANLLILEKEWAWDFLLFAQRNPKPCPVLEVGEPGDPTVRFLAEQADVRTDLPLYRVFQQGRFKEQVPDIGFLWNDQCVFFLVGCSFSFEQALLEADIEIRHITEKKNVPMYATSINCPGAGRIPDLPMVVSMRPMTPQNAMKAAAITREFPSVHGAPVHLGEPRQIGIEDIDAPDWGDAVTIGDGEVPVFWACGVTLLMAATRARLPFAVTHSPGHMFVGDRKNHGFRI
jgi:uncharacterized protein YcsI (UPF0317 family)